MLRKQFVISRNRTVATTRKNDSSFPNCARWKGIIMSMSFIRVPYEYHMYPNPSHLSCLFFTVTFGHLPLLFLTCLGPKSQTPLKKHCSYIPYTRRVQLDGYASVLQMKPIRTILGGGFGSNTLSQSKRLNKNEENRNQNISRRRHG